MMSTDFADAVKTGGLVALEALRDQIADDLGRCESFRDRCGLYLRLTDVLSRIEQARTALPTPGDAIDQLQRRRAKRMGPAGTGRQRNLLVD